MTCTTLSAWHDGNGRARIRQLRVALQPGRNSSLLEYWHHDKRDVPFYRVSVDLLEEAENIHKRHALPARRCIYSNASNLQLMSCADRYLALSRISNFVSPHPATSYLTYNTHLHPIDLLLAPEFTTDHHHPLSGNGRTAAPAVILLRFATGIRSGHL
ncbi:hypothetical protein BU25DRAFT_11614 [Macroventuria anomochaeta]|uniref:Uncharacterized protein n=1 Tax=Macroventuria anomochaeta TaxID=301207 RepID=A0ACB6SK36_9PLEO|nr:uncharacterized protein BU25DRAFT_11614 [Macroventuria anomochaeta]KAF2633712.1 hypothetical protein BU25DRAFT_11614 [Macroventuria anomochaeta]